MISTTLTLAGKTIDIDYEFDKGEPADATDPGQAPRADIHSIKYQGLELIEMLDPSWLKHFEERVYYAECAQ